MILTTVSSQFHSLLLFLLLIHLVWDWRDGSIVQNTGYFFRGPKFNSQYPCSDLQLSVTPDLGNPAHSLPSASTACHSLCMQANICLT